MKTLFLLLLLSVLPASCYTQVMQQGVIASKPASAGPCGTPGSISDSFSGASGTALATYNSCWINLSGTYVVSALKLGTTAGTVVLTSPFALAGALYNGDTSDTAQITQNTPATATLTVAGPMVRATQNSTLGYWGVLKTISGGNYTNACVYKAGAQQGCSVVSYATASPHTVKIVATGTGPVVLTVYIDGTLAATSTDSSSPYASGTAGFAIQGNNTNVLDSVFSSYLDH